MPGNALTDIAAVAKVGHNDLARNTVSLLAGALHGWAGVRRHPDVTGSAACYDCCTNLCDFGEMQRRTVLLAGAGLEADRRALG